MTSKGANFECCMCGDSGLSYELFRCKVCQFRSQHRYCSNLYPKADTYRVCNWCLFQKQEEGVGTASNHSADQDPKTAKKKQLPASVDHHHKIACKSTQPASPIKKPKSLPEGPSPGRKRVVGSGAGEGEESSLIRRTRSEEIANGRVTPVPRHVFRNKVRRYKLLEEVSS